jgi:hypothetical protein
MFFFVARTAAILALLFSFVHTGTGAASEGELGSVVLRVGDVRGHPGDFVEFSVTLHHTVLDLRGVEHRISQNDSLVFIEDEYQPGTVTTLCGRDASAILGTRKS